MANPLELKITRYINGNSITDTLNGAAVTLKHTYNPKPGDGESDISETVQLVLEGAQATVQSTVNTINRYLADARARNENGYATGCTSKRGRARRRSGGAARLQTGG